MIRSTIAVLCLTFLLQPCFAEAPQDPFQDPHPNKVEDFMRVKLVHAQKLLEGLAVEDYAAIEKNAQQLSLLSLGSTWQVFNTVEYTKQSGEFRRTTDDIRKAAQNKNLDGATLSYMEMTMKCIQCHKYVRGARTKSLESILEGDAKSPRVEK